MHLAGHQHCGTHIVDTHDRPVRADVWKLYRIARARTGDVSTLLEWDGNIPPFAECHAEVLKANRAIAADRADTAPGGGVSNPVDFLVPQVMDSTVLANA
jgi:uncharacterized protein (UPF0276 family)